VSDWLAVSIYLHGHDRWWAILVIVLIGYSVFALFVLARRQDYVLVAIFATLAVVLLAWPASRIHRNTNNYNRCQAIKRDFGHQGLSIHANACNTRHIVLNTTPGCMQLPVRAAKPNQIWRAIPLDKQLRRSVIGGYITQAELIALAHKICK
jgi:hypothetical protein